MLHVLEENSVKAAGFVMRRPLGTLHFATSAKEMQGWEIKEGEEAWVQKLVTCPDVTKRITATGTNSFRAGLHLAKDNTVPSGSHTVKDIWVFYSYAFGVESKNSLPKHEIYVDSE